MLIGPAAHRQIRASGIGVFDFEECRSAETASYTVTVTVFFSDGAVPVRIVREPAPNRSRTGPRFCSCRDEVCDLAGRIRG